MTLDKAISRNVELKGELIREGRLEKAKGVQLGIEALDAIEAWRNIEDNVDLMHLPSETED